MKNANKRVPKQYRKYLKFSRNDLNKLIDFDSYVFYKSGEYLFKNDKYCYTELHSVYFKIFKNEVFDAYIYKHKTKEEYLLTILWNYKSGFENYLNTIYIYALDSDIKCIHRENLPAIIKTVSNKYSDVINLIYISKNMYHRLYGPQSFEYFFNKNEEKSIVIYLQYFQNNKKHRTNGPAYIYISNGKFKIIEYYINNKLIKDKPSKFQYNSVDGNLEDITILHDDYNYENYSLTYSYSYVKNKRIKITTTHKCIRDDKLHNMIGPAITVKDHELKKTYKAWYIDGKEFNDNIIKVDKGIIQRPVTKRDIIETILFDREYGMYIKGLLDEKSSKTI